MPTAVVKSFSQQSHFLGENSLSELTRGQESMSPCEGVTDNLPSTVGMPPHLRMLPLPASPKWDVKPRTSGLTHRGPWAFVDCQHYFNGAGSVKKHADCA